MSLESRLQGFTFFLKAIISKDGLSLHACDLTELFTNFILSLLIEAMVLSKLTTEINLIEFSETYFWVDIYVLLEMLDMDWLIFPVLEKKIKNIPLEILRFPRILERFSF